MRNKANVSVVLLLHTGGLRWFPYVFCLIFSWQLEGSPIVVAQNDKFEGKELLALFLL